MNVRVEREGLSPGVEHGEEAHAGTKPRAAEIEQGLTRTSKQEDDRGRVQGQHIESVGDGEDDVKVRDVEGFFAAGVEPSLAGLSTAPGAMTVAA